MSAMPIVIDDHYNLDEGDFQIAFVRSSGPGGQHVNKTATKAQLRFNLHTAALPDAMKERLHKLSAKRINEHGELVIEAQRYRTREQNRQDAIDRLVRLLRLSAQEPQVRRKTRATTASRRQRLESKKRRGETKRLRRRIPAGSDYS